MASANQRKATFISQKLKFLKDQEHHLISDVELYVSRIITAGESWIEGRDTQIEYQELNQMIDNAVEFLCEKCEELAGVLVDVAANQLSWSSCEQSNLATQVITGTASSSAASYNQPAASVQPAGPECNPNFAKMTSANQRKSTFISKKLKFLKDQGDHLINDVGLYVSRIITAEESWIEGRGIHIEYQELSQMIDNAAEFLCEKCDELAGRSVDVAANQLSRPSCEQSNLATQVITATASSSATSCRQTAVPLASTETKSYNQSAVSVQHEDERLLKPVLARIANIEEALCSFSENAKNSAEQQRGIDQQLKELFCQLSESDKKHSSRFRKVKEQISEISDVQDAINEEHRTRLQSLERQLQKVSTAQDRLDKEVELQAELAEKLVHLPNQLEAVKENVDVLDARIERIILHCVKRNTQVLNTVMDRNIDDCLKENFKVLNTRTDRIIEECNIKHECIKILTDDLVDKVTVNTDTIQVISEGQEQKMTLLRELETRLKTLEADGGRNVKHFQKQFEKAEANLRILCQMLNDRLTPLEQLRTSLNERASMRDDNIKKVTKKSAVMSPRLQLELKASATGCGFTAYLFFSENGTHEVLKNYKIRNSSAGNSFDTDSGIFTAPFDGLYVAFVSIKLSENKVLHASVEYQPNLSAMSTLVCECSAALRGITACCVGVVDMKVGDKLFTSVYGTPASGNFNLVNFTCFMLI